MMSPLTINTNIVIIIVVSILTLINFLKTIVMIKLISPHRNSPSQNGCYRESLILSLLALHLEHKDCHLHHNSLNFDFLLERSMLLRK